jgi:hypothetical protein
MRFLTRATRALCWSRRRVCSVALGSGWVVRSGCALKERDREAWYRGEGRYSFERVYAAEVSWKVGVREMPLLGLVSLQTIRWWRCFVKGNRSDDIWSKR